MRENKGFAVEATVPFLVRAVPSQLEPEDRAVYYTAAKQNLTQDGALVDTGTLAGGSSVALAAGGLAAEIRRDDAFLHAFDLFRCDWSTPEFFKASFGGAWSTGSNFRAVYDDMVAPFRRFIRVYEGDLLQVGAWSGPPIDVLGVDVWKNHDLATHSLRLFFPSLRPGSLVLHQDYMTVWLPWIHSYMQALSPFFERAHETRYPFGATVTFRAKTCIPTSAIEDAIGAYAEIARVRRLKQAAVTAARQPAAAACVELAHAVAEARLCGRETALHYLDRVDICAAPEIFRQYLADVRAYVSTF